MSKGIEGIEGIKGIEGIMEKWNNGKSEECDVKKYFSVN